MDCATIVFSDRARAKPKSQSLMVPLLPTCLKWDQYVCRLGHLGCTVVTHCREHAERMRTNQDVLRLHVSVYDVVRVQVEQRTDKLL
jgi:hypothetical protein